MATDGVVIASLCGRARRHSIIGTETDAAVTELREVSTSPTPLGSAAGTFMASHRTETRSSIRSIGELPISCWRPVEISSRPNSRGRGLASGSGARGAKARA